MLTRWFSGIAVGLMSIGNDKKAPSVLGTRSTIRRDDMFHRTVTKQFVTALCIAVGLGALAAGTVGFASDIRTVQIDQARTALLKLSADQQEVLILRFGQGLGLQETADIMDRTVSAIKSLQFRAVNALRQILGETSEEFGNG